MTEKVKQKRKLESLITPPVTLKYAYLAQPDDKYRTFSVQGVFDPANNPDDKAFVDTLRTKASELIDQMLANVDDKKKQFILKSYKRELPVKDELVDYQPTGKLVLKARSNIEHPPSVFIVVKGKLELTTKPVFSGSLGEIKVLLNPYICDAQKTYGVSCLLVAVKVNKFGASKGGIGAAIGFSAGADTEECSVETPPDIDTSDAEDDDGETGNF